MSRGLGLSKIEQEKLKLVQNKIQEQLAMMLKEEENRYCADCDAKGPRWASWNLGIFLCIRCAGIHRNLGVHISKVKSVNLDSWTPEQAQSMRVIGNSTARGVYEANIPEHFRRPQSDSAMEAFIRAKYDQKRYIMKNWIKPPVNVADLPCWDEIQDIKHGGSGKRATTRKTTTPGKAPLPGAPVAPVAKAAPPVQRPAASTAAPVPAVKESAVSDLLGLSTPAPAVPAAAPPAGAMGDLFGLATPAPVVQGFPPAAPPAPIPQSASNSELLMEAAKDAPTPGGPKSNTDILALFASSAATSPMTQMPPAQPPMGPFAGAFPPQGAQQAFGAPQGYGQSGAFYGGHQQPAFPVAPQPNHNAFGPMQGYVSPQQGQASAFPPAAAQPFAGLGQLSGQMGGMGLGGPNGGPNTLSTNLWQ